MIDFGLSAKRAVVSGAGYIPERAGHGWFTSLALAEAGTSRSALTELAEGLLRNDGTESPVLEGRSLVDSLWRDLASGPISRRESRKTPMCPESGSVLAARCPASSGAKSHAREPGFHRPNARACRHRCWPHF